MAKKTTRRGKKREKAHQVDHIPKCSQQRRSPGGPRPRTDFSLFFCSSSSSTMPNASRGRGLLLDASNSRDMIASASVTSFGSKGEKSNEMLELHQTECNNFQDEVQGHSSSVVEVPLEVESVDHNAVSEGGRNVYKQTRDIVDNLELTPDRSQIRESNNTSCTSPGSLIWAKKSHQLWWPAKVLGERSSSVDSEDQVLDGYVLVQYYGNHESAWVDPMTDVSLFDACFEERSCNPMKEFQDALEQAMQQKNILNSGEQFSGTPASPDCLPQQGQSPDQWDSSRSSRTESDSPERRRGKRERKPTVRFDEVRIPAKSVRKARRFRVMRFLGLAAPVGSPFAASPM